MKNLFFLLFSITTFVSCRSTAVLKKEFDADQNTPFLPLNAVFHNSDSIANYDKSLLKFLTDNGKRKQDTIQNWQNLTVRLETLEKKIKISAYEKDSLVFETERKGKTEENFFKIKRRIHWFGVPVLFWTYNESLLLLKTDANGNLLLARGVIYCGGMIFMIAGDDYYTNYKYSIIK